MSILLALALAVSPATASVDASKLTFSPPATLVEIDTGKLKGDLLRLAWSPDTTQLYLLTVERDSAGNVKNMHHYVLGLDGKAPRSVNAEPLWANAYWAWKSTQAAPGLPSFKIDIEQQDKRVTTTATPMGGDLARGAPSGSAPGTSVGEGVAAGFGFQTARFITLKLKGEVVGEFVNAPAVPGLTFGWGPAGTGVVAFANPDGHVVVMDDQGRKQEIRSSKDALLPGWTDDGKRLAYLEKTGKKKFALRVVDVTGLAQ